MDRPEQFFDVYCNVKMVNTIAGIWLCKIPWRQILCMPVLAFRGSTGARILELEDAISIDSPLPAKIYSKLLLLEGNLGTPHKTSYLRYFNPSKQYHSKNKRYSTHQGDNRILSRGHAPTRVKASGICWMLFIRMCWIIFLGVFIVRFL